jgi:hypothetical protein
MHLFNIWNVYQLMSLFYSYIAGSLHVSGPPAHLQESSYSCSHSHWFSFCAALLACSVCCHNTQSTRAEWHRNWTNGCVNSCTNSPEDGPVGPKHVEIQQYKNKIVTSVGFHSISITDIYFISFKVIRWQHVSASIIGPSSGHNRMKYMYNICCHLITLNEVK